MINNFNITCKRCGGCNVSVIELINGNVVFVCNECDCDEVIIDNQKAVVNFGWTDG